VVQSFDRHVRSLAAEMRLRLRLYAGESKT
jgi:hypothetical protein